MEQFKDFMQGLLLDTIKINSVGLTLPFSLSKLIISLVLPILLGLVAYHFLKLGMQKLLVHTRLKEKTQTVVLRWFKILLKVLYTVMVIVQVAGLFGAELLPALSGIFTVLNAPLVNSGSTNISIVTLLLAIPVFYVAGWAGKIAKTFIKVSFIDRIPNMDESKKFTALTLVRYLVMVLVVLIGLSMIGIDLTTLTVLLGVLGIGIGFGLQNMVNNLIAGFVIIFSRPIKEGDRISVGSLEGTVTQIKLISTIVTTLANETIIVPNSELVHNQVHNFSFSDRKVVIKNTVSVAYDSDMDAVLHLLNQTAARNPYRLSGSQPMSRIEQFGASGIEILVFTWVRDVTDKFSAFGWNNLEFWRALKKEGITIPFPQLDLFVKNPGSPLPAPSNTEE